ncbi:hypothetical protein [Corynebacterium sp. TAE3-ERU16]|uniref:hypothetical protein n=1 Tax=Corynebacterium sp. TAE3-ERU16 TaxID=2849493 RepID=UPI001C451617|nr:hypothetical protein [Corynebacterium sp. TAE3-ERU16]MBV7292616.1 hypothetical protein [Corynebacterium sp. TAE3-ERU16]
MNGTRPPYGYTPGFGQDSDGGQYFPGDSEASEWSSDFKPQDYSGAVPPYGAEYGSGGSYPDYGTTGSADFGEPVPTGTSSGTISENSAPVVSLVPSLVLAVVSLILSGVITFSSMGPTDSSYRAMSLIAWAAAGVVGITAMSLYFIADTKRRALGFYQIVSWKQAVYFATVVLLFVAVVWSAVEIGLWVGKL